MNALRKDELYTIDDIYKLPDGRRAELIDGYIYNMAPPTIKHQKLLMYIARKIGNYIESNNGEWDVFPASHAVFLNNDEYNYVEPDISVICDTSKLDDKGCHGAPDWVTEIVSPSSRRMDYVIKLFKYQRAGVREYWIVDPTKNKITVYDFENSDMNEYTFSDKVKAGIYEDLEIDFSQINKPI